MCVVKELVCWIRYAANMEERSAFAPRPCAHHVDAFRIRFDNTDGDDLGFLKGFLKGW